MGSQCRNNRLADLQCLPQGVDFLAPTAAVEVRMTMGMADAALAASSFDFTFSINRSYFPSLLTIPMLLVLSGRTDSLFSHCFVLYTGKKTSE